MHKKLLKAGSYSLVVVIPKIWLAEQGDLSELGLQFGESRIVVIPVTKARHKAEVMNEREAEIQ